MSYWLCEAAKAFPKTLQGLSEGKLNKTPRGWKVKPAAGEAYQRGSQSEAESREQHPVSAFKQILN